MSLAPFVFSRPAFSAPTINITSWPGFFGDDVIGPWEEKTGIKVNVKGYTSGEEMVSLLQSSPPGTFDLALADNEYINQLRSIDAIDALEAEQLPIADYWPEFQHFGGNWHDGKLYAPVVEFGYLGLVYNTEVVTDAEARSYKVMWSDKVRHKVGCYDWYLNPMMQLSIYNGNNPANSLSDDKFGHLKETLMDLAPRMSGVGPWSSVFSQLTNKEAYVMLGVGDWAAVLLQSNKVPVKAVVPDEGGLQWSDCLAVVKTSQNKDAALSLLKYLMSPEGQTRIAMKSSYSASIPNKKGWELLNKEHPEWAARLNMRLDQPNVMDVYRTGRIQLRDIPKGQPVDDWTDAFTEFKGAI